MSAHECQFVRGVLFAPSSSSHVVPLLSKMFTKLMGHTLNLANTFLYLAYGTNANGHMSAISFGLLFEK
jgi:hypothetical protein